MTVRQFKKKLLPSKPQSSLMTALAQSVMDADLAAVRSCDAIYLLRGWESSRGAKKELAEAIKCGLLVKQEGDEVCDTRE